MTLSILICSIPERFATLQVLVDKLLLQSYNFPEVEIIVFLDNKKRTIGEKRDGAVSLARGKYFILLDDDDDCSDDYVEELVKAAESNADIISFDQKAVIRAATWSGESTVNFSLQNEDEEFNIGGITKRKPYSVCAFKTEKFKHLSFGKTNYGEDKIFSEQAWAIAESEHHIDKILHVYTFDEKITAAK